MLSGLNEISSEALGDGVLKVRRESGILFSSGLIAGSALVGVGLALLASYSRTFVTTLKIGYIVDGIIS